MTLSCEQALTVRSPEMLAPARMPVAAGKKMANTEKKVSSSRKSGPMFSIMMAAAKRPRRRERGMKRRREGWRGGETEG